MIDALLSWFALVVATLGLTGGGALTAGGSTAAVAVTIALIAARPLSELVPCEQAMRTGSFMAWCLPQSPRRQH